MKVSKLKDGEFILGILLHKEGLAFNIPNKLANSLGEERMTKIKGYMDETMDMLYDSYEEEMKNKPKKQ